MPKAIEVSFTPADFSAFPQQDLSNAWTVVFDVLRATSSMITALANGAASILPASAIPEALALRARMSNTLLAGERNGLRITRDLTGSVDFDLGNSPREFTKLAVMGKTIIMTTTNGTRALRACARAQRVLVCSFLNLSRVAAFIREHTPPNLLLVCSGTFEQAAGEDVLCAGALADCLWDLYSGDASDAAVIARKLFLLEGKDLSAALGSTRNGGRLLSRPELRDDVAFCAQCDAYPILGEQRPDGSIVPLSAGTERA